MIRRLVLLAAVVAATMLLASCSDSAEEGAATGGGGAVTIVNFSFEPAGTDVSVGDTVTWTNDPASAGHTTTSHDGLWDSSVLMGGDTFEHTFTETGRFSYFCSIHPSMNATVTVEG